MEDQLLQPGDRDYVGALAAGLEVLQAFDAEHARMTLSEVAARTEMDRAKARRFLLTLHALGFVKRSGRQFELTPRVLQLGYAYQASNNYRAVILQHLEDITAELGESSSLAVLDSDDVVYVLRSSARHRLMAITLSVGTRLPAAYTSMGRVLLGQLSEAELDAYFARVTLHAFTALSVTRPAALKEEIIKAREQGYAIVDQELDSGLRSVAVPVFAGNGELLGAINISTNAARVDMQTLKDVYLSRLQQAAEAVRQSTR
ncbi:MAG: helix-turn-helix domain-containing protein [Pseudomonas sp.]|uniref:IclR family transcriptional regulator n=1 Tax=Pseudomonas neustonica TaxID=2487346 RepID=A0ABX9XJ33_9PSED|nr:MULTISPECIES: IclR family transcriptional regulator C-terminal domain-containing protein [Pseudomonas]MBA6421040.1 helix-turn-helix domain-containing protein [Pseudomonas sp. 5Ae-yellow]MBL4834954.1 helix-turn-helix domain-containing protein [Pseudomonas sp.]ROZ80947.1 IclR family transcriptional regulator [Pseudomonas sp. SSM44]ROZ82145.1 IclR family transcriptional regulator [Pseudomonas neustonica]